MSVLEDVFSGGQAGLWIDASDLSTGYLDSDATTPQTGDGDQTGLRLDKRFSAALRIGANLVSNGDFASGLTGWTDVSTPTGAASVVSGKLRLTNGASAGQSGRAQQLISGFTVGQQYRLSLDNSAANSGNGKIGCGIFTGSGLTGSTLTSVAWNDSGSIGKIFTASATSLYVAAFCADSTATFFGDLDNIVVRAWNGNHLFQTQVAQRPTYSELLANASDFYDGLDDNLTSAVIPAGTLTSAMDMFVVINPASNTGRIFAANSGALYAGWYAGTGAGNTSGIGNPTAYVNGNLVGTTNTQLRAGLGLNNWNLVEYRSANLSTVTSFIISNSPVISGDIGAIVICPAQPPFRQDAIRQLLADQFGISLPKSVAGLPSRDPKKRKVVIEDDGVMRIMTLPEARAFLRLKWEQAQKEQEGFPEIAPKRGRSKKKLILPKLEAIRLPEFEDVKVGEVPLIQALATNLSLVAIEAALARAEDDAEVLLLLS